MAEKTSRLQYTSESASRFPGISLPSVLTGLANQINLTIPLLLLALLIWATSLRWIDIRAMNDLGLISVMPPLTFVGVGILLVSFILALRQEPLRVWILFVHTLVLIFMLYGITTLVQERPRFLISYVHAGFSEYIMRTGDLLPMLDARFSWPGFFSLTAFLTQALGLSNPIDLMWWASVAFNLLYLGPLLMIMRALTPDRRVVWLAIWFYYLNNWIGQDYYAPQALHMFLYLMILALVLTWFKAMTGEPRPAPAFFNRLGILSGPAHLVWSVLFAQDTPNREAQPWQRSALVVIIALSAIAIVSSHQLTPIILIFVLGGLMVLQRTSLRGLPVMLGVIVVAWIVYMATVYIAGHFNTIVGAGGGGSVAANVVNRFSGSPEHRFVIYMRVGMTLFIWVVAFLGALNRLRKGYRDVLALVMAGAPFPMIVLQSYGGEMMLRIYFFTLPFMALLAAMLFLSDPGVRPRWRTSFVILGATIIMFFGFTYTRYGNERMDYYTNTEVELIDELYKYVKPGDALMSITHNLPWRFRDVEKYQIVPVVTEFVLDKIDGVLRLVDRFSDRRIYFVISRSQKAYGELFIGLPHGWGDQLEQEILATGVFQVLYRNAEGLLMVYEPGTPIPLSPGE